MDERKLKLEMYFLYRALIDTTEQRLLFPEVDERKLKLRKLFLYRAFIDTTEQRLLLPEGDERELKKESDYTGCL